jgi:hypothetical protein
MLSEKKGYSQLKIPAGFLLTYVFHAPNSPEFFVSLTFLENFRRASLCRTEYGPEPSKEG